MLVKTKASCLGTYIRDHNLQLQKQHVNLCGYIGARNMCKHEHRKRKRTRDRRNEHFTLKFVFPESAHGCVDIQLTLK